MLDYDLPPHLIAQQPCPQRDQARLLAVDRATATIRHHHFHNLPELLRPGDLLVRNNTKVLPARLYGARASTGGRWEGLFLSADVEGRWELLAKSRFRPRPGESIALDPGPLLLRYVGRTPAGHWLFTPSEPGAPAELLARYGHLPLPPYIRQGRAADADADRYQTVYAHAPGSVAAPTAGLHFTPAVFAALAERGVTVADVTLHVGVGTFAPIRDSADTHIMHREWCELPAATAAAIAACRARGGRVVAVGTTTVRTLETAAAQGASGAWAGATDIFIRPPYQFRTVDALVTNFHLPRTTLLLLVAAFAGEELTQRAYAEAVAREYRFFSYGDAMFMA